MDYNSLLNVGILIALSIVLGGIIGLQRESVNRPAGFRTHILVCLGAAIVMYTNLELYEFYPAAVDPGRFGAAVISGIGFLGAGTILKEGSSVKGLTTAASLWSIACIGLVIGSGLYPIAIAATLTVYLTLRLFHRLESRISRSAQEIDLYVTTIDQPGQLGKIGNELGAMDVSVRNIEMYSVGDHMINIRIRVKIPPRIDNILVLDRLSSIEGISKVYTD